MKRSKSTIIILMILLLSTFLNSCQQDSRKVQVSQLASAKSSLVELTKDQYTITKKEVDYMSNYNYFDILSYKKIDYIKIEDAYTLLNQIVGVYLKFDFSGDKAKDIARIFDTANNRISVKTYTFASPEKKIIWLFNQSNFLIKQPNNDYFCNNNVTNLSDFNVSYVKADNNIYIPIMLMNYAFLSDEMHISPYPLKTKYKLNGADQSLVVWQSNSDSPESLEFSARYLWNYLKRYYPYDFKMTNLVNPNEIDFKKISSDDYFKYIYGQLNSLEDGHTYFDSYSGPRPTDETYQSTIRDSFLYKIDQKYNTEINKNSKFKTSEYSILAGNIGYIRINSFMESTFTDKLPLIFKDLKETKALIVDIRYNQGGMSPYMLKLLACFKEDGDDFIINYKNMENGKLSDQKKLLLTKSGGLHYKKPVVLLTNNFSFSAANMCAGLFKDNNLGTIIGEKTGGGGSNTHINVLPDGSFFNCSVSYIADTDNSGNYYELGIEPDIYVEDNFDNGGDAVLETAVKYLSENK